MELNREPARARLGKRDAPPYGREHAKAFSALMSWVFECDWQQLFRPMMRRKSFVNSSTQRRLRKKTE